MAFTAAGKPGPLADINVTPLVDVMLVLLIIFIVTAPMVSMPIPVNLPQPTTVVPPISPPPPIELRVDASNQVSWNGQAVAVGSLQQRMQALPKPTPETCRSCESQPIPTPNTT